MTNMNSKHSRGSVLIISLLVLLVLTLLGVTALDSTVMEERMSANTRQRNVAYQAAETALKRAEQWLSNGAGNVVFQSDIGKFNASAELYDSSISAKALDWDINNAGNWKTGNSQAAAMDSFPSDTSIIPGAPRYIIEYVGRIGDPPLNFTDPDLREFAFRVVAIGWGADTSTKVVLSSTFSKRLG